ncbi:hypothetical protein PV783_33550 [Chitinophaga sp. CC14]|uniref:hypothetical protein n=1 Tax=Chitinophaga sp. CC14 TaxID=3029199 RepID=UPI003B7B4892
MQQIFSRYATAWQPLRSRLIAAPLLMLILSACAKQTTAPGSASLTMINAVVGNSSLVTNFNGSNPFDYYLANRIYYKAFNENNNCYTQFSGSQPLALYQYPDTTEKSVPLFNLVLDLPLGSIHTLFLTGTVTAPDTLFVKDDLPYQLTTDSSMGIRFVNLSPGSNDISINIKGQTGAPEVARLPYKGSTIFKDYSAGFEVPDYEFEFRDAASGALLGSYITVGIYHQTTVWAHPWMYKNFTLALVGLPGGAGTSAPAVMLIKY